MTIGWAMIFGAVSVLVFQAVVKDLKKADERLMQEKVHARQSKRIRRNYGR